MAAARAAPRDLTSELGEAGAARLASAPPYGVGVRGRGATGGGPAGERCSGRGPGPRPGSQLLTWRRGEWRGETVGGKRPCPVHPRRLSLLRGVATERTLQRGTPATSCLHLHQPACPHAHPARHCRASATSVLLTRNGQALVTRSRRVESLRPDVSPPVLESWLCHVLSPCSKCQPGGVAWICAWNRREEGSCSLENLTFTASGAERLFLQKSPSKPLTSRLRKAEKPDEATPLLTSGPDALISYLVT
ncbi:uncharacterized protein LOC106696500 [Myotis lucifugus]|uniref:uncharacterized protein LOC106696500 n=1 Tax=Myotis lucifugus TaxID=59463 RepID=UPI0006D7342C|nr:uncharacterized protein LOC106696500 [Myotis lucifugus]